MVKATNIVPTSLSASALTPVLPSNIASSPQGKRKAPTSSPAHPLAPTCLRPDLIARSFSNISHPASGQAQGPHVLSSPSPCPYLPPSHHSASRSMIFVWGCEIMGGLGWDGASLPKG
ncbi:MAG TPA: hypothetical protein VFU49_11975 [Ktedonobacteraceae bacterium]|nr:hypothetical protein [Ktedonobacteraceae bacterium]